VTRLWAGRFGVWIPAGARVFFSLYQNVQTGSGAHPAFELGFPGVKAAGVWSYCSRPFRAKVKNACSCSSIRPVCLLGVERSSFTCYLVACLFSFLANCRGVFYMSSTRIHVYGQTHSLFVRHCWIILPVVWVVGIATRLRTGQPRNRGWILAGARGFSLLRRVQACSGTHPDSF